ncbi:hypothetical protein M9Y10_023595 [Tritrichomonas musculus]|uniref:Uncharacterized protein n=1 Tax=Tritrichomonas musculus TaxID=1915356 RepID=A0ABR2KVS6_9EUKA
MKKENKWVWRPIQASSLACFSIEKSNEIALPDVVHNASSFEDVLKCYGVDICDDTPTLYDNKPVLGKYIIKGDLEVNGKIICDGEGGGIVSTDFTREPGYPDYTLTNDKLCIDTF